MGTKIDFAPLLPPGGHQLDLQGIHERCVDRFAGPAKAHRKALFQSLEEAVQEILVERISCKVLVDGSFVTEKPKPCDVDIMVLLDTDVTDSLSDQQRMLVDRLTTEEYIYRLDSAVYTVFPIGHKDCGTGLDYRDYAEAYGVEHSGQWLKGYAILRLWETDVGLRLYR